MILVPKPTAKISTVVQAKNLAAGERAAVKIRLDHGRKISRSALIDHLIGLADMAALVASYRQPASRRKVGK